MPYKHRASFLVVNPDEAPTTPASPDPSKPQTSTEKGSDGEEILDQDAKRRQDKATKPPVIHKSKARNIFLDIRDVYAAYQPNEVIGSYFALFHSVVDSLDGLTALWMRA